jgi:hypothetical protein
MINDDLIMTGALTIEKNGEVVRKVKNLVVTVGKAWVAKRMADQDTVMTHMEVGTGTTAAAASQTALVAAGLTGGRAALTVSGGTVSGATINYSATWAAGAATGAITEAGIFDAATSGEMLARTVFAVVNKGVSDSVTISWTITIS